MGASLPAFKEFGTVEGKEPYLYCLEGTPKIGKYELYVLAPVC